MNHPDLETRMALARIEFCVVADKLLSLHAENLASKRKTRVVSRKKPVRRARKKK